DHRRCRRLAGQLDRRRRGTADLPAVGRPRLVRRRLHLFGAEDPAADFQYLARPDRYLHGRCHHRGDHRPADRRTLRSSLVTLLEARPRHPETVNRPDTEMLRKPDWIRVKAPGSPVYRETQQIVRENNLVTVCEEAGCPNIGECWSKKHATMMIMGEICTRACAFCNVATGLPTALDPNEPENVANAVEKLGLAHVVITSVDRDDLPDGGAEHFAKVIRAIRARTPSTTIEVLTPDFLRKEGALEVVVAAKPDVFNHNLETVPSKYLTVRPGARYFHSIRLLQRVKELDP